MFVFCSISESKCENHEESVEVKPKEKKRKLASIELLEPEFEPLKTTENGIDSDSEVIVKKKRPKRYFSVK